MTSVDQYTLLAHLDQSRVQRSRVEGSRTGTLRARALTHQTQAEAPVPVARPGAETGRRACGFGKEEKGNSVKPLRALEDKYDSLGKGLKYFPFHQYHRLGYIQEQYWD